MAEGEKVDNVGLGEAESEELAAAKAEETAKAEEAAAAAAKEAEGAKDPAVDGAPKGDAAKPGEGEEETTLDTGPRARRTFSVEVPEDIDEQIKAAKEARDGLGKQFEEGEFGVGEFTSKMAGASDTLNELNQLKRDGANATRMTSELHQQAWEESLENFWGEQPEYTNEGGELRIAAFKAALSQVNTTENASRSFGWFIKEAHKRVTSTFGEAKPAGDVDPNPKVELPGKGKAEEKAKQAASLPKTLGNVPAAGGETIGADEFSTLDNLEGMELEAALSKMPSDKAAKYLDTTLIHG